MKPEPAPHPLLPAETQAAYRRQGHWADLTLAEVVRDRASLDPDRPAIAGPHRMTYGELWDRSSRLAGGLADAGLRPGEFLLAVMPNSWQGVVLAVAGSICGAALSSLSPRVSPTLASNIFDQTGARGLALYSGLLADDRWRVTLERLRARLDGRPVLVQGDPDAALQGVATLEELSATGPAIEPRDPDPGRPSLILTTGGTTGMPKIVVHCDNTLLYAAREYGRALELTERDVLVSFGPYGHASGSLFELYTPLLFGAAIVPQARWRARPVAEAIARWSGTCCITVGTHLYDLLALEPGSESLLRSLRVIASGAGAPQIFEEVERRFGVKVVRGFGLSECPGHARGRPSDPPEIRLRTDGPPFDGVEFLICDPDTGNAVLSGVPGEYLCRAPSLFMGYHGRPDLTAAAVTVDGFYRTGDLMLYDSTGCLTWSGRLKDVIRRGGLQIDVIEMEDMLSRHPKVADVVVVGEPDPRMGERAVVVAVPAEESEPDLPELVEHLTRCGLSKESLPERLVLRDSLPRTARGKIPRADVKRWVAEQPTSPKPAGTGGARS
jgi:cyclohexanecarboxylate-CoA ligase